MLVQIIDTFTKEILTTADITFGLDTFIVHSSNNWPIEQIDKLLYSKSILPRTYEIDDVVLKALDLYDRKHEFGRMTDAKILYAMLNYFKTDNDPIIISPVETEVVSMISLDFRFSNIYIWRPYYDINVPK